MPRVAASNGVRPEIRALAVFKVGVPVTPSEINAHVGTGDYAAKYVSFLNTRYGFTITAQKDKRKVVSYTMVAEPDNAAVLRASQPKQPKAKAPKVPTKAPKTPKSKVAKSAPTAPAKVQKVAAAAKKSVSDIKAANLAKLKAVGAKIKSEKTELEVLNDAPKSTTFSIDGDWDSIDGLDLSSLI